MKYAITVILIVSTAFVYSCTTAPSGITELGSETGQATVKGEQIYFSWFGLSKKEKSLVYEASLKKAIDNAPEGTAYLDDVKVWTTKYIAPYTIPLLVSSAATLTVSWLALHGETDIRIIADIGAIASLVAVLSSGFEIEKYVVSGVPVIK